jgi:hypothetical protein
LLSAQVTLWRLVFAEIGDLLFSYADCLGRFSVVVAPSTIQDLDHFLWGEKAEILVVKAVGFRTLERVFRSIAALVRNDQVQIAASPQIAIAPQTSDCSQIVRFLAQAVLVKFCDRRIHYFGCPKGGQ